MMEKKALGRGISALIPEKETQKEEKILFLNTEQIRPNPHQPREDFGEQTLQELIQSIKEKGIIQPVLVRRKADAYELIAGERRWRAACQLNLAQIPAIVKEVEDEESLELALIENVQREDLNPVEEARAYQFLINKFQMTQEKLAQIVGKSRVSITNTLRLLKLPQEIQKEIKRGRISFAHGRLLLEIDDVNEQRLMGQQILSNSLSVRELENLIRKYKHTRLRHKKKVRRPPSYIVFIQEELQHILGTKVQINQGRKRGFIQIEFYSQQDLERILEILKK
jgi:ParB family chromosome partitioning protein